MSTIHVPTMYPSGLREKAEQLIELANDLDKLEESDEYYDGKVRFLLHVLNGTITNLEKYKWTEKEFEEPVW